MKPVYVLIYGQVTLKIARLVWILTRVREDFKLEDFRLCVLRLEYADSRIGLAEALKRVFEEFGLQDKMTS